MSGRTILLLGAVALIAPASAFAQAPRLPAFRPDVSFGIVFDDNVFSRPEPTGDIFMRLTPGFDLVHDSTRLTLRGSLHFDAERYQEQEELSTPVARQATSFDVRWRPNSRFAMTTRAGYQRTQTPQDLNVTTGLTGGRQEASRVDFSLAIENTIRPTRRLSLGADVAYDDLTFGQDSNLRAAHAGYTQQLNARTDLSFNYRFEQREFLPGPVITSHIGTTVFSRRLSRDTRLMLEGGLRVADGDALPEVNISVTETLNGLTSFTAGYSHTQDVAVGVIGLITLDRIYGSVAMRRSRFWELTVGGGGYRNVQPVTDTIAYDASVSLGRAITRTLWLVASVNRTMNDNRIGSTAVPGTRILRNWATISLRYTPFQPR